MLPGVRGPDRLAAASVDDQVAVTLHDADTDRPAVRRGSPQRRATVVEHQIPIALIDEPVAAVCGGDRLVGVKYLPGLHIITLGSGTQRKPGVGRPHRCAVRAVDHHVAVVLDDEPAAGMLPGVRGPDRLHCGVVDDQVPVALHDADAHGGSVGVRRPQRCPTIVEHQVPIALVDEGVAAVRRGDRLTRVEHLSGLHVITLSRRTRWEPRARVVGGRRDDRGMLVRLRNALVLGGIPRPREVLDPELIERVAGRPGLDVAVQPGVAALRAVDEVRIDPLRVPGLQLPQREQPVDV